MEEGYFHSTSAFPRPPPSAVNQKGHWPFSFKKKKKAQYACAHTPVTLCTIKKWGQGNERIEKTIL